MPDETPGVEVQEEVSTEVPEVVEQEAAPESAAEVSQSVGS